MENRVTLKDVQAFPAMTLRRREHTALEKKLPPLELPVVDKTAMFGIEIEVENIHTAFDTFDPYNVGHNKRALSYYWNYCADGSLRNNGVEFTSIPLRADQVERATNWLATNLTSNNNPKFSTRTSVHVHLNVRDMTEEEIKVLLLLYCVFERHFFSVAGTKRESGIYCVPVYKTRNMQFMQKTHNLAYVLHCWQKYSAINPGTIFGNGDVACYGTVEFRHMYGTLDPVLITEWCNQIACLRVAAMRMTYDEVMDKINTMNTTSEYYGLYAAIFQQYARVRDLTKRDFEDCVSSLKANLHRSVGYSLMGAATNNSTYAEHPAEKPVEAPEPTKNVQQKAPKFFWNAPNITIVEKTTQTTATTAKLAAAKVKAILGELAEVNVPHWEDL